MAASEFEKNIGKVMDELKLHPSEEVWLTVEKRIRGEKRKRRILFFILFSCIGLALGGYAINNFVNHKKINSKQENAITDKKTDIPKLPGTETSSVEKIRTGNMSIHQDVSRKKTINKKPANNKPSFVQRHKPKETVNNLAQNTRPLYSQQKDQGSTAISMNDKKEQSTEKITGTKEKNTTRNTYPINNNQNPIDSGDQKNISPPVQKDNVVVNNPVDTIAKSKSTNSVNEPLVSQEKKISKPIVSAKKIKWGIHFSGGSSRITQNLLLHKEGTPSYSNSYTIPGTGATGGISGITNPQSGIHSSFAFKMGISANKKISTRSNLSLGIEYAYLSDKIKTGARQTNNTQLNSLFNISAFYGANAREPFTDRFHFIELPVSYDWRITGNANHYLSVSVGLSLTHLISTNALVYDTTAGGIYYHNKKLFARTGIEFIPGLSYHFITRTFEFVIGPQVSLGLNKAMRSDLDKRNYFFYSGIDASFIFGGKKKK